jgi:hypothetical protein
MVRLLLLAVLLLMGGYAFQNRWIVVDWQKVGSDLNVPSLFDQKIFGAPRKLPTPDNKPSR